MYRPFKRKAVVSVPWDQQIKFALRTALASAILNLESSQKTSPPEGALRVSVIVDGEWQNDWEIARVSIGSKGTQELVLARMLINEKGVNFATDFVLVLLQYQNSTRRPSRRPIQYIVRIDHPYENKNYRSSYAKDRWIRDWDKALSSLMEEAIS